MHVMLKLQHGPNIGKYGRVIVNALPGASPPRPGYDDTLARGSRCTVASLPDEQQDEFARILLQLAGHEQPVYVLTPEEEADLDASIAAEESGDFATDQEMLVIRAKYAR
jgi:hypothetical protein